MRIHSQLAFRPALAWALIGVLSAAFISLFLSLQAGIFTLFFIVLAWWTWGHVEEGFLFLLIIAPLLPLLKITESIGTITLVKDVIILALFVKVFAGPLLTKTLPYRRNVLLMPIIFLLVWTGFELLRADSLILGILRARDIVLYILLYFAVLYLRHDGTRMRERLAWFSLGLGGLLLLGVYQWFFALDSAVLRFDPVRSIWIPRLSSTLAHPSIFGEYLVMAVALFGALVVTARSLYQRWWWFLAALILVPFIFLTYSRAVWFGLLVVGGMFVVGLAARLALRKISRRALAAYLGGMAIAVLVVGILLIQFTPIDVFIRTAFDPTYGSNEERLEFLARLIAPLTNTEALFGQGLGDVLKQNFRTVDLAAIDIATGAARSVQLTKNRTLVDNQYLKTLVEMGLVGLLIYAWLYWRFFSSAWALAMYQNSALRIEITLGFWGIGFLGAFVIQALFIDIWDIFPTNMYFWIVAGCVSACAGLIDRKKATKNFGWLMKTNNSMWPGPSNYGGGIPVAARCMASPLGLASRLQAVAVVVVVVFVVIADIKFEHWRMNARIRGSS